MPHFIRIKSNALSYIYLITYIRIVQQIALQTVFFFLQKSFEFSTCLFVFLWAFLINVTLQLSMFSARGGFKKEANFEGARAKRMQFLSQNFPKSAQKRLFSPVFSKV